MAHQARSHSGRLPHDVRVRQPAPHPTGLEGGLVGTCSWEGRVLGSEKVNLAKPSRSLLGELPLHQFTMHSPCSQMVH